MKGYLVDPFKKTVEEVETSGYPHFKELIDVDILCAVTVTMMKDRSFDTMWIDDEGLLKEDQAYFQVSSYAQPLAGKGILLGTNKDGETVSAYMSFEQFKAMISFPDIELDHLEQIPEGTTEKIPLFGETPLPVVGSYPVFRHKSDTASDD